MHVEVLSNWYRVKSGGRTILTSETYNSHKDAVRAAQRFRASLTVLFGTKGDIQVRDLIKNPKKGK